MSPKGGYKNLVVWQKSMLLAKEVYHVTLKLPVDEKYGLISQMRRAAVSIPSNIAEGSKRGTEKDFKHFLIMSIGSLAELETQIELIKMLPFGKKIDFSNVDVVVGEVMRMLTAMIKSRRLYQHTSND